MFRSRRRGGNFGVMMLVMQLYQFGFNRIPPVTLVAILGQLAIFLRVGNLSRWFGSWRDVCISTHYVLRQKQWSRLVLGTLVHGDDMHLYFNMVSLLWKGVFLERRFKSQYFAFLLAVFTVLTSTTLVGLNWIMAEVYGDRSYELGHCAVGFSGVLFALKVLTTHYSPAGFHYALGFIPVPSKYFYWAELGIIQLVYPNASFTGHLAGILVGLLYIKGPLKTIMDCFWPAEPSYRYMADSTGYRTPNNRGYTTGGGRNSNYNGDNGQQDNRYQTGPDNNYQTGADNRYQTGADNRYQTGADNRYEEYTGGFSEEEQIRQATEQSQSNNGGQSNQSNRLYPDLRRRRADRYT